MTLLDHAVRLGLLGVAWLYVWLAPFTKVEESFSIQAVRDTLTFGIGREAKSQFDHVTFPGAVPRSFVGPTLLSVISFPVLLASQAAGLVQDSADAGFVVRLNLATCHALSVAFFARATFRTSSRRNGAKVALHERRTFLLAYRFSLLFYTTQFQGLFWGGRTTPNGMILPVVFVALGLVLSRDRKGHQLTGIALLTASAVIARVEIIGVLAPACLCVSLFGGNRDQVVKRAKDDVTKQDHRHSQLTALWRVVSVVFVSGIASLLLTVLLDTYMWNRPFRLWNPLAYDGTSTKGLLWPEFESIIFNVIEGKSSEWGVSPWHEYLTVHLLKLNSVPLLYTLVGLPALWRAKSVGCTSLRRATIIASFHIALMSGLGHKETRFIAYTTPLVMSIAAYGAAMVWQANGRPSLLRTLSRLSILATLATSIAMSTIYVMASMANYPGGEALATLHAIALDQHATVHIDVLAAQTGVTLFQSIFHPDHRAPSGAFGVASLPSALGPTTRPSVWSYDKTEDVFAQQYDGSTTYEQLIETFTYLLSDDVRCHQPRRFSLMRDQTGKPYSFSEFAGLRVLRPREYIQRLQGLGSNVKRAPSDLRLLLPLDLRRREVVWLCERRRVQNEEKLEGSWVKESMD